MVYRVRFEETVPTKAGRSNLFNGSSHRHNHTQQQQQQYYRKAPSINGSSSRSADGMDSVIHGRRVKASSPHEHMFKFERDKVYILAPARSSSGKLGSDDSHHKLGAGARQSGSTTGRRSRTGSAGSGGSCSSRSSGSASVASSDFHFKTTKSTADPNWSFDSSQPDSMSQDIPVFTQDYTHTSGIRIFTPEKKDKGKPVFAAKKNLGDAYPHSVLTNPLTSSPVVMPIYGVPGAPPPTYHNIDWTYQNLHRGHMQNGSLPHGGLLLRNGKSVYPNGDVFSSKSGTTTPGLSESGATSTVDGAYFPSSFYAVQDPAQQTGTNTSLLNMHF